MACLTMGRGERKATCFIKAYLSPPLLNFILVCKTMTFLYSSSLATPNASSSTRSSYNNAVPPSRPGFDVGGFKMGGGGTLCHNQIFPISSLSPYQNRWTIRVRVSSKPSIRTWSNSRGEGRVFNVDIVDESVSSSNCCCCCCCCRSLSFYTSYITDYC